MPFENILEAFQGLGCGLIFYVHDEPVAVPLRSVDIKAKVVDFVAEVLVEQSYVNQENNPIEVVFMFPVEESAAVTNFEAEVDGRTIVTYVKAKNEAAEEYKKALSDRKTAVLLEETTPDIFRIKVGQLKPGAGAKIKITYISELPVEENCVRLTIPTTIAPRYVPPTDHSNASKIISSIPYSLDSPAPLKFCLEVMAQSRIKAIKSPSHSLTTSIKDLPDEHGQFSGTSELTCHTTDLNKDVIVMIENANDDHQPIVYVEKTSENTLAGMVSLIPSFKLDDQKIELVFLVDRSGSMGYGYNRTGGSIEAAKQALNLFLHSLPMDCYFNIYSFGSHFDSLFKESQKYDDKTLAEAKIHVASMAANYGGTEIYQPLNAIFEEKQKAGYLRQVFVLTDGQVSNADNVIELAKKNCTKGRIFALGLGSSVSRHLVKGIARGGGGTALFATEGEDLRPKVMSQLKSAMQPAISEVKVTWEGIPEDKESVVDLEAKKTLLGFTMSKKEKKISIDGQAPAYVPPVYDGTRLLVYRIFPKELTKAPKSVKIEAVTPDGPFRVDVAITKANYIEGQFVHQLAARKRIQDLEETTVGKDHTAQELQEAITELGIKYRLASRHTSFVGVDPKETIVSEEVMITSVVSEEVMITRVVKNQVPSGFGMGSGQRVTTGGPPQYGYEPRHILVRGSPQYGGGLAGMAVYGGDSELEKPCGGGPQPWELPYGRPPYGRPSYGRPPYGRPPYGRPPYGRPSYGRPPHLKELTGGGLPLEELTGGEPVGKGSCSGGSLTERDPLTDLIGLQTSDGHFTWGEPIHAQSGYTRDQLMALKPDFASDDQWSTALAMALLQKLTDQQDLWELVVKKARKCLVNRLGLNKAAQVIVAAEKALGMF